MKASRLRSILPQICAVCAAVTIALASTGCTTVAQAGLDYATRKVIDGSVASVSLDERTLDLTAVVERQANPPGSGVLVVRVSAEGGWPMGWHPMQFSFRPEGSSQSFSFVEIDADGELLRAIGKDGFQPGFDRTANARIIRLRISGASHQTYELLVTLRNPDGRRANLALRSIQAR
jgi:hypothetical protein